MILALDHFKADSTTNSNSISNAWNFLFMEVSGMALYHPKLYNLKGGISILINIYLFNFF